MDEAGYFGQATGSFDSSTTALTYGTDFCLWTGGEDNASSRSGILVRVNQLWPKPSVRQRGWLSPFVAEGFGNCKVIYTAGWTTDTLPADFRWATNLLVARMRTMMPLGMESTGDSFDEKSVSYAVDRKLYLMALVRPHLMKYKNWHW